MQNVITLFLIDTIGFDEESHHSLELSLTIIFVTGHEPWIEERHVSKKCASQGIFSQQPADNRDNKCLR